MPQLRQMAQAGRITRDTSVRQANAAAWSAAGSIPELFPAAAYGLAQGRGPAGGPEARPPAPRPKSPQAIPGPGQHAVRAPLAPAAANYGGQADRNRRRTQSSAAFWGVSGSIGVLLVGLTLLLVTVIRSRGAPEIAQESTPPESSFNASPAREKRTGAAGAGKQGSPNDGKSAPTPAAPPSTKPDTRPTQPGSKDRQPPNTSPKPPNDSPDPDRILATDEIARIADSSVALIRGKRVGGTGFLIKNKVLATNYHVVQPEFIKDIVVTFPTAASDDRGPYTATLLYEDPVRDLAFLAVNTGLPALRLADDLQFPRGHKIVVIGNTGTGGGTLSNAI
ncbi:MAG TPA: trypsin-like peptidase domain-containing protein, partial [Planctomycetaceae bacterium]